MKKNKDCMGAGRGAGTRPTRPTRHKSVLVMRDDGIREVINAPKEDVSDKLSAIFVQMANTGHDLWRNLLEVLSENNDTEAIFAVVALTPLPITDTSSAILVLGIRRGEFAARPTEADFAELTQRFKFMGNPQGWPGGDGTAPSSTAPNSPIIEAHIRRSDENIMATRPTKSVRHKTVLLASDDGKSEVIDKINEELSGDELGKALQTANMGFEIWRRLLAVLPEKDGSGETRLMVTARPPQVITDDVSASLVFCIRQGDFSGEPTEAVFAELIQRFKMLP